MSDARPCREDAERDPGEAGDDGSETDPLHASRDRPDPRCDREDADCGGPHGLSQRQRGEHEQEREQAESDAEHADRPRFGQLRQREAPPRLGLGDHVAPRLALPTPELLPSLPEVEHEHVGSDEEDDEPLDQQA